MKRNNQYFSASQWDGTPISFFDAVAAKPREIRLVDSEPWIVTVEPDGSRTKYRRASRNDIALGLRLNARQNDGLTLDLGSGGQGPSGAQNP